ncbi:hypothetical protein [Serratia sp. M24T3]|nr:hypothetical protein [Serratia sp. M24T3]
MKSLKLLILLVGCLLMPASYAASVTNYHLVSTLTLPTDMLLNGVQNPWRGKTLRAGILSDNSSPYNILIANDYYGLNADYLSYVQQVTGIHFAISGYSSPEALLEALKQGQIDAIFGVPQN